ncbi:catalase [Oleiharenicola lentus]|uniref:catalase n=1 Tax=Oleiharenicola lentus TaxID=2508720 RepID=UPI003F674394
MKNFFSKAPANTSQPPPLAKKGTCPIAALRKFFGGETHQEAPAGVPSLTTNQGIPIADNQNSLKAGIGGPTLLEDFVLREKITHFDHERIPERIVHARGSGAHGFFESYGDLSDVTRARFLEAGKKTPVFVRFSTVAGGAGSGDLPRDVRGFSVKFYTEEGNFDLVGNNIPVFFIQDAMKFPDLIHAVKKEPDRGYPEAASAHDTFWDFISLMPESMHMIMWAMSDRTIPRSLRMIQGFGVHTFRLINADGKSTFVKFHWRPLLGCASVLWDEAVKINGADPDFHRRDLYEAIARGDAPEWELGFQLFDQKTADALDFDVLDPTKLIPEEIIPVRYVGKLTLDRNPDNFFAETEQVAFCPANIVPGIDFSNDPLLQGRLFSYLDTQLSRLGGPNFHQIPVNAPRCPMRNFQRDGLRQMTVPKGRVAYEPSSLDNGHVRENPAVGFQTFATKGAPETLDAEKTRRRKETFADHYSQARMFFRSLEAPERRHLINAFTFELSKVESKPVRCRMLGHLHLVDSELGKIVEEMMGMAGQAQFVTPAVPVRDIAPSPAVSLHAQMKETLKGRKVGVLLGDGFDSGILHALQGAVDAEHACLVKVTPKIGGARNRDGLLFEGDMALSGGPSLFFDAVVVLTSDESAAKLATEAAAVDWIRDAFGHLKVVGASESSQPLLNAAGVEPDEGLVVLSAKDVVKEFIAAARRGRIWDREPKLRSLGQR